MTRSDELLAIERHVRDKGVTRCPPFDRDVMLDASLAVIRAQLATRSEKQRRRFVMWNTRKEKGRGIARRPREVSSLTGSLLQLGRCRQQK